MVLLRRHPPPHTMADSTSPPSVLPPVNPLEFKPGSLNSEAGSFPRRGRWGWRDWFGFYLPRYDGPHSVGTLTLELPVPKPFSDYQLSSPLKLVKPPNEPALQLHSSLFTLFYPTDAEPRRAESRLKWISLSQIKGYLRFAGIGSWKRFLAIPLALLTMGQTRLPTRGGAPIAPTDGSKRKLVLFCHGLTGNRTCYSQLCGQLAARGYVVAALEHRDSSGSHSVANRVAGKTRSAVEVPYVDMDDLTPDTRPENYLYARAYQLELRTLELLAASKLLGRLAEPNGWKWIRSENLRVKGSAGWTGDDGASWDEREWARFAGAVRWNEDVITAGHSFGGATVLACARHPLRPAHWTKFILYDPWLETLDYWPRGSPALMAQSKIEFPSLVINSPGFTDWPSHFGSLVRVVEESRKSWLLTVGGIIHSSFSDLPILAERLWRLVGQLEFDSQHALDLITRASIEFIEDKPGAVLNQKGASSKQLLSRPRELPLGTVHLHVKPCEEKASR